MQYYIIKKMIDMKFKMYTSIIKVRYIRYGVSVSFQAFLQTVISSVITLTFFSLELTNTILYSRNSNLQWLLYHLLYLLFSIQKW
jgi:hypothetical protein